MSDFKGDNIIDVKDLVARADDIQEEIDFIEEEHPVPDLATAQGLRWEDLKEELNTINEVLNEIRGYGNRRIRGNLYPDQLINRSYWVDYVKLYAIDSGQYDDSKAWPYDCIDWNEAADTLEDSYSSVTFDGDEYLYAD